MFKNRSVIEVMVIVLTFTSAFAILASGATIAIIEIKNPGADTSTATQTLTTLISGIIGALLGLLAGKNETIALSKRPSEKENNNVSH